MFIGLSMLAIICFAVSGVIWINTKGGNTVSTISCILGFVIAFFAMWGAL